MDDPKYVQMKQWIDAHGDEEMIQIDPKTQILIDKIRNNKHKLLHSLIIQHESNVVLSAIYNGRKQTALGFVLNEKCVKDIGLYLDVIVDDLLKADAELFAKESSTLHALFVYAIAHKQDESPFYFDLLDKIIKQCEVSILSICDANRNNPLHIILQIQHDKEAADNDSDQNTQSSFFLSTMSYLCKAYPAWMSMQNDDDHIPLYFAIVNRNMNAFYCLCRYMTEHGMDVKTHFRKRSFVQAMVDFGSELLDKENLMMMKLLLSTFDYPEIFRFSSDRNKFDATVTSNDVSLIKFVSQKPHKKMIDDILFDKCFVNKAYANEYALKGSTDKTKKTGVHEDEPQKEDSDSEEDETKEQEDDDDDDDDDENDEQKEILDDTEDASLDWIELVYTTIVETFSALDLYTDILIMMQLMKSKNQWWSTWMLFLLASPYLVSHGSLVVILQKKLSFNQTQKGCCSIECVCERVCACVNLSYLNIDFKN